MWSGTSRCGSPTTRSTPISATPPPAKVLHGAIKRGAGERMRAIIWVSDLRGFTDLSGRLGDANMIALLNAYFDCLAGAVLRHGGEVLKFMGDGLLAVFPIEGEADAKAGCDSGGGGSTGCASAGLDRLNATAPPPLDSFDGWNPLRTGIALHEGDVFFGNIGAPERLDFTVIGSAVNEASRVEALQKTLGRSLLITDAAARHLDCKLDDLGEHALRGVEGTSADFQSGIVVARMERSAIRGMSCHDHSIPDFASLHPGYDQQDARRSRYCRAISLRATASPSSACSGFMVMTTLRSVPVNVNGAA